MLEGITLKTCDGATRPWIPAYSRTRRDVICSFNPGPALHSFKSIKPGLGITSRGAQLTDSPASPITTPSFPCSISTMAPRLSLPSTAAAALRRQAARPAAPTHRLFYSTESSNPGPLVRVTDLPAPHTGHIRILELNRPSARNAISRALLGSLREEIDAVYAQYNAATGDEVPQPSWSQRFGGAAGESFKGPTRALIIASAVDTSFCAGADLKERRGFTQEE